MGSSRDQAIGDIQGLVQAVMESSDRIPANMRFGSYQVPNLAQLSSYLSGQQQRALGTAGQAAGGQASAYGMNPYAAIQHAQAPIYGQYANAFAGLPLQQAQLGLHQFGLLAQLLGLKGGLAGQRESEGGDIGGFVGNLGGAAITKWSDCRLKKNIIKIGEYRQRAGIYLYQYLWNNDFEIGVMADEIEKIIPQAVGMFHGYKYVHYEMLR